MADYDRNSRDRPSSFGQLINESIFDRTGDAGVVLPTVSTPTNTDGTGISGPFNETGESMFLAKGGASFSGGQWTINSSTGLDLDKYTEGSGATDYNPAATFADFEWAEAPTTGICRLHDGLYLFRSDIYDPPATTFYVQVAVLGCVAGYATTTLPIGTYMGSATDSIYSWAAVLPVIMDQADNPFDLTIRYRFYTSARALILTGSGLGVDLQITPILLV